MKGASYLSLSRLRARSLADALLKLLVAIVAQTFGMMIMGCASSPLTSSDRYFSHDCPLLDRSRAMAADRRSSVIPFTGCTCHDKLTRTRVITVERAMARALPTAN